MRGRRVLLLGEDVCYLRMLSFALAEAGFLPCETPDDFPDCAVVDLDTAQAPVGIPTVGYSRTERESADCALLLVRPFAVSALIGALSRLEGKEEAAEAVSEGLFLDASAHQVFLGEKHLTLMPAEYALLSRLYAAEGEAVSRAELQEALPSGAPRTSNLVEVTVCTLRRKLENAFGIRSIRTVRGIGYRYER